MSLKQNINKVHFELTANFNEVSIVEKSSLQMGNYFELSVLENNKEVKLLIKKTDIESRSFDWSYLSNPLNEKSDLVERHSSIDNISEHIKDIFDKNRFDSDYKFNESVGEKFLRDLYINGAISSDVYDVTKSETDFSDLTGTDNEIKKEILDNLYDCGGISTDAYHIEVDELKK